MGSPSGGFDERNQTDFEGWSARLPSLQVGGFVLDDGLVNLHAGEVVKDEDRLRELIREESGGGVMFNQTINYSNDGTREREDNGDQMADIMAEAVIAIIDQEQRPGGMLEGTGSAQ
jgi:hypothetical protein